MHAPRRHGCGAGGGRLGACDAALTALLPRTHARTRPRSPHATPPHALLPPTPAVCHGFAGYFDATLYRDVHLSIHPDTHTTNMFSWFPIYFPLRAPLALAPGEGSLPGGAGGRAGGRGPLCRRCCRARGVVALASHAHHARPRPPAPLRRSQGGGAHVAMRGQAQGVVRVGGDPAPGLAHPQSQRPLVSRWPLRSEALARHYSAPCLSSAAPASASARTALPLPAPELTVNEWLCAGACSPPSPAAVRASRPRR